MSHTHTFSRYVLASAFKRVGDTFQIGDAQVYTDGPVPGQWFVGYECACGEQGYAA